MRIIIVVAVVLCLGLLGYGAWCSAQSMKGVDRIHEEIQRQERVQTGDVLMATLTTTWKTANGVQHSVTTTQAAGETPTAFAARHRDIVTAAQLIYPPA